MRAISSLLPIAALAGAISAQQQLLCPFHHHLSEAALPTTVSTSFFRSTAGRFQVLYDAPNFLQAGVTGPITITKIKFRGEDTEQNHGGQFYDNVTVQLGSTSLAASTATWSTTWATNWAPALPDTTTPGPIGFLPVLTVAPSLGTAPNNFHIEIDLAALGATFTFDPTSSEPNLLIEIIMPTPPGFTIGTSLALIGTQDTTGNAAQLAGSARTSSLPAGATGVTVTPPPIGIEFTGPGGYSTLIPARVESYGAACGGSASTFYQLWQHNAAFDLAGTALTMLPDNPVTPNAYLVTSGSSAPFDPLQVNATPSSTADDAIVTHALGFTFNYPGGSTTDIAACTNGFIWLDTAMTSSDFTPTLDEFLGTGLFTARLSPMWHDLNGSRNTLSHPNSGMHVLTDVSAGPGNAVCYVTWLNVGRANTSALNGGHAVYNLQCAIFEATGSVEFRYGTMSALEGSNASGVTAITGFTRGQILGVNSVDPQSRDLSIETPFATQLEGTTNNIGLVPVQAPTVPTNAPGRMFGGQSVTWNATFVPAGALLGVQLLDVAASRPGFQFPGITAPGCMLSTSTGALLWEVFPLPGATVTGTVPLTIPAGYLPTLLGTDIHAQFVLLDGLFAGPNLITASSSSLKHTIGLQ